MPKTCLITGITGQDGSYLAELLLLKGYVVHGLVRRVAVDRLDNINHLISNTKFHLHWGDMATENHLCWLIHELRPGEIYNLAGQSDVAASFDIPEYTGDVTGLGVTRLLEAVRLFSPDSKVYQASTSEMFGDAPAPQNELTPLVARSPYAAAKIYAHNMVRCYREAYGMFACSGISFNHESVPKHSPIIIRDNEGLVDVLPIEDLFKSENHRYEGVKDKYIGCDVWDGEGWTKLHRGFCYRDTLKTMKLVQTRQSCYEATHTHITYLEDGSESETKDIVEGDKLFKPLYPVMYNGLHIDRDEARFIGFVVGDGNISDLGFIRLTGTNIEELESIAHLVTKKYGWEYKVNNKGISRYPNGKKAIYGLDIKNDSNWGRWLRKNIYTIRSYEKRIPSFILNGDNDTKLAFWDGYYSADGRRAGHEKYLYKGFTTKSATLCLGLVLLFRTLSKAEIKVKAEYREKRRYYYAQITSPVETNKGKHLVRVKNEVIKVIDTNSEDGWFYDLETNSHCFATGANLVKVHNSERRGLNFVTRKISNAVAKIHLGKQDKLLLGNIDAKRDWGYAPDYVRAAWMIMQQEKPDDFVIGTGETHTVRDFLETAFAVVELDWRDYTDYNTPSFNRPSDISCLVADPSKALRVLGWEAQVKFSKLVEIMVLYDLNREGK